MIKKVDILGAKYKIKSVPLSELNKQTKLDGYIFGCCDYETRIIYINKNLKGQGYDETLRHECVHAFFKEAGLDYECGFARDEMLVDWIALMIPRMADTFKELGILDTYYDNSANNQSTPTAVVQTGDRGANKHWAKVLR